MLVSIKPIHSIVANVMGDTGTPELLLPDNASPHSYALKPSDARAIAGADAIFWIGPVLEAFLETPLKNLAPRATKVALLDAQGVTRLPARQGGLWEADEDHDTGGIDGHAWLDPDSGVAMARAVARTLSTLDAPRAAVYAANAEAFAGRIARLDAALQARLAPVRGKSYLVFHDATHYFDAHYELSPIGSVTIASDRPPGARRIEALRRKIRGAGAICLFATPQFSSRLIAPLTEGTAARTAVLDAMGTDIAAGPAHYETLLTEIADSFSACLSG